MKVLFINYVITIGGATLALKELLIELKNNGIEPIVCTSKRDDFNSFLDDNGIKNIVDGHREVMENVPKSKIKRIVKYLLHKPLYYIAQYRALRIIEKSINLKEIDIVHSNSVRSDLGCLIHEKYHIPHLMHIREFSIEHFWGRIYKKGYYDYLNANCNRFLAVSEAVRLAWISHGLDASKIQTLYDGVDFRNFKTKNRNTSTSENLRMVIVGAVYEEKGQHIAIEAINKLPKNIKDHVYLDIIGWRDSKRYCKYLDRMIAEYGLDNQVRFIGAIDDVGRILSDYDIGLMCSKAEGFGRVTVEYMYAGLAVIAANTGATHELITDDVEGLIFERDEYEDLVEKIVSLYKKRELVLTYGLNAHNKAKEHFANYTTVDEVSKVYNNLIKPML